MKPSEALRRANIDTIVNVLPEVLHAPHRSRGINETVTGVTLRAHYDPVLGRTGDLIIANVNDPASSGDIVPFRDDDAFESTGVPDRNALVYKYRTNGMDYNPGTIKRIAGNVLRAGYKENPLSRWRRAAGYLLLRNWDF